MSNRTNGEGPEEKIRKPARSDELGTAPKIGDTAGVYVPVYLDGVIEAIHDDGSATVRVEGFTLQVLPDHDEPERHDTVWRYDPMDPARIRWERERRVGEQIQR